MKIEGFDTTKNVLIVAEIGNNHEGSYTLAEELIGLAAKAGAGAVKFQTFRTELYVTRKDKKRFEQLKNFELTPAEFQRLGEIAKQAGILFISTAFDLESASFLKEMVSAYKIASGDNNFYPLIDFVTETGKPLIVSTGLTEIPALLQVKNRIEGIWRRIDLNPGLSFLHCVSCYPVTPKFANLGAIQDLRKHLQCTIGYSDHTVGIEAAKIATALGAEIIEKHFTINKRHSDFRDHQLSADPAELKSLVESVNTIKDMIGSGKKDIQDCERELMIPLRRSIAAKESIRRGETISHEKLTWVRPGGGFLPGQENLLVGRKLKRDLEPGEIVMPDFLEKD